LEFKKPHKESVAGLDPALINNEFCLKFEFTSTAGGASKKYIGNIDTILDFGVSIKTKETPATGHNISFSIFKETRKILNGTGKISTISDDDKVSGLKIVVCTFNQFSEQDKKTLQKEAELSQDNVNNYMDDLS